MKRVRTATPDINIGEGSSVALTAADVTTPLLTHKVIDFVSKQRADSVRISLMSTKVFVLDKKQRPLMPCSAARARWLLKTRRARVARLYPFTIRLVDRLLENSAIQETVVKIDPGAQKTGIAIAREGKDQVHHALAFFCLVHRGDQIREALKFRNIMRHHRRSRKLRHRAPRFSNRGRAPGWLPPSINHRLVTVLSWANKFQQLVPVTRFVVERVRFDTHKMQDPNVAGLEYQHGTLFGYSVKEYLLEKFQRRCVYCGKTGIPLNIDHIVPKSRGGTNRISNLVLACERCNQKKGNKSIETFLKNEPALLRRIHAQLQQPLADATVVNACRNAIVQQLQATGLPVEIGIGAQTKFNRYSYGIPKTHWLDALCVGKLKGVADYAKLDVLRIWCAGRGAYKRTRLTSQGSVRGYLLRQKKVFGFATGDMVKAVVPEGQPKAGTYVGRVAIRKTGSFNIQTPTGTVQAIHHRWCTKLANNQGYGFSWLPSLQHSSAPTPVA